MLFESALLTFDHSLVSPFVILVGVECSSVLEFEYLLLDVGCLVILRVAGIGLLEVELIEVVSLVGQNLLPI